MLCFVSVLNGKLYGRKSKESTTFRCIHSFLGNNYTHILNAFILCLDLCRSRNGLYEEMLQTR